MATNFNYDKLIKPSIKLDKVQLIEAKREWENSWVSSKLKTTFFIKLLDTYGFKFSDFLIIYLFTTIVFCRIDREQSKKMVKELKLLITITKKEEEDLIRNGFKRSKHQKKICKRLMRAYFNEIGKMNVPGISDFNCSDVTTRDCLILILDEALKVNASSDCVIDELGTAVDNNNAQLFIYNYLTSIYMDYEDALKAVYIYGEVLSGELKDAIQDEFIGQLSMFIRNTTNDSSKIDEALNNFGLDLAVNLVDSENIKLQNDKAFYSKRYLETVHEVTTLKETIKELQEELAFFKEMYKNKLSNKKLLLIGDKKKKDEYEEIVHSFGGEMVMCDSFDDFSKINNSMLDGFDYIIHFTYYTSHSVSNKLSKYSDNLFFVNSSSKLELEKVLISI